MEQALVPVQRRVIKWDDSGLPQLVSEPVLTKTHIRAAYFLIAAEPYVVDDPFDPDFGKYDGMTIAEVLVRKEIEAAIRSNSIAEIESIMDRLIDKPLARAENHNVNASYEDFLRRTEAKVRGAINAEVVASASVFGDLA